MIPRDSPHDIEAGRKPRASGDDPGPGGLTAHSKW